VKRTPALELRDVSYVADGKKILDRVTWIVDQGEHWAILGPNGAGKTTLLKLACGYLWPNDGGEIRRKGRALVNLPHLRRSIGWVTSTLAAEIPPREKVIRTVLSGKFAQIGYFDRFGDKPTTKDYAQAQVYVNQMGCGHLRDHDFGVLSQGEQQRVLIARARMTTPYLIILDEPCAGMDPAARESFLTSLKALGKQTQIPSLIYVTHHLEEIVPMFRNTLVMKEGKILNSGRTRRVIKPDLLEELYGVSLMIVKRKGRFWPIVK
jgi:iron complex transport system ATP-binding protein